MPGWFSHRLRDARTGSRTLNCVWLRSNALESRTGRLKISKHSNWISSRVENLSSSRKGELYHRPFWPGLCSLASSPNPSTRRFATEQAIDLAWLTLRLLRNTQFLGRCTGLQRASFGASTERTDRTRSIDRISPHTTTPGTEPSHSVTPLASLITGGSAHP